MIRTVSSFKPTARKRHLCSPTGTLPNAIQLTSVDICFLSVYSLSCPDCTKSGNKKYNIDLFRQCSIYRVLQPPWCNILECNIMSFYWCDVNTLIKYFSFKSCMLLFTSLASQHVRSELGYLKLAS